jgi:sorting nexin-1/2
MPQTNCPMYRNVNTEYTVSRRYRDFLWIYNQLVDKYPGAIVPPVPEKHAIGRFQDEFVEARRAALEKCIRKISAIPLFQVDEDVRLFLESETFSTDV